LRNNRYDDNEEVEILNRLLEQQRSRHRGK
jgi:hypothetical protein